MRNYIELFYTIVITCYKLVSITYLFHIPCFNLWLIILKTVTMAQSRQITK